MGWKNKSGGRAFRLVVGEMISAIRGLPDHKLVAAVLAVVGVLFSS